MLMRELRAVFGEAAFSAKCRATDHNGLVELAKESQPSQFMDWENIPNPLMENHGDELQVGKNKNFRHELAKIIMWDDKSRLFPRNAYRAGAPAPQVIR